MTTMKITEALAEIKTIDARLEKKRQFVLSHVVRDQKLCDPLEKDGGSINVLRQEEQAIRDLEDRKVRIRLAIQQANLSTNLMIGKKNWTIAQWLVWKREVAPHQSNFMVQKQNELGISRRRRHDRWSDDDDRSKKNVGYIVNIDEKALAEQAEESAQILGELDGKLSLLNATVDVNVD